MRIVIFVAQLICAVILSCSCARDQGTPNYEGYPKEIGQIIVNKCATSGCHTPKSANACAQLDLSSWEALFKGSRSNSVVVPLRADLSFLFHSINTYCDLGPEHKPTMPLNSAVLTKREVISIRDWINEGARNNKGLLRFSGGSSSEIYVANQGCDLISVFDARTKLLTGVFEAGNSTKTESPHDMIVSPDGEHLYISYFLTNVIHKYRTNDHSRVGELLLQEDSWHAMAVSGDSRFGLVTHLSENGKAKLVDLVNMKELVTLVFSNAHGCALNYDGSKAYVTSQQGNYIYKLDISDPQDIKSFEIPLQTGGNPMIVGEHKPYAVSFFPDYSKYAVTCQGTNEVRIFDAEKDSLIKIIRVDAVPQLMSFSKRHPYLFVSCMSETANSQASSRVSIIEYNTLQQLTTVFSGYQPRGLVVDDAHNFVWVANRNIAPVGWQPHHTTGCNGKNGYVTIIDMNTFQLVPGWKAEVSVDPYCVSIKK